MTGILMLAAVAAVVLTWRGLTAHAETAHTSPRRYAYRVTASDGGELSGFAASREEVLAIAQRFAGSDPLTLIDNTKGHRA